MVCSPNTEGISQFQRYRTAEPKPAANIARNTMAMIKVFAILSALLLGMMVFSFSPFLQFTGIVLRTLPAISRADAILHIASERAGYLCLIRFRRPVQRKCVPRLPEL